MKLLTFLLLAISVSLSSAVSASEYCNTFKSGYRSVTKNLTIEPVCPPEPPIVFGQRNSVRGFNAGIKAAKAEHELGISNGYEKKERCENGGCRFKDIHYSINAVFGVMMVIYGAFAFLSAVIFKEPIFLRLRHRHRGTWEEIGSPKLFAVMENFHLLQGLSESKAKMNEISQSDQFLFWLINFTIKIEKLVSKATWLILAGALIAGVNLLLAKFF